MKNLEEFVIEKLKVTKGSGVPNLLSILESTNSKDYAAQCKNLLDYLKNDSDLPVAELNDSQYNLKRLDRKYQNSNDAFLYVGDVIFYGTWDKMCTMQWYGLKTGVRNYTNGKDGFKDFICNDQEINKSYGIFIITENEELMKQIDILMKKAEQTPF